MKTKNLKTVNQSDRKFKRTLRNAIKRFTKFANQLSDQELKNEVIEFTGILNKAYQKLLAGKSLNPKTRTVILSMIADADSTAADNCPQHAVTQQKTTLRKVA